MNTIRNTPRDRIKAINYKIAQQAAAFGLPVETGAELAQDALAMLEAKESMHRIITKVRICMRDLYWQQHRGSI